MTLTPRDPTWHHGHREHPRSGGPAVTAAGAALVLAYARAGEESPSERRPGTAAHASLTRLARRDGTSLSVKARDPLREALESHAHADCAIETRLTTSPERYGAPLRGSLGGYRKLRVGDYRVVLTVEGAEVRVPTILHRTAVYERVATRTAWRPR
jgi:mRNA-degrading endonuclease RelE of RelBE toxin-antitoxin system